MLVRKDLMKKGVVEDSDIQSKLNDLLDKISLNGLTSLNNIEDDFLHSFKNGEEREFYKRFSYRIYLSDNNLFEFTLTDIIDKDDIIELIGEMTLPSLDLEMEFINIKGTFEVLKDDALIFPKFEIEGYTPYDFIEGKEFEFDDFVQDILEDILEI